MSILDETFDYMTPSQQMRYDSECLARSYQDELDDLLRSAIKKVAKIEDIFAFEQLEVRAAMSQLFSLGNEMETEKLPYFGWHNEQHSMQVTIREYCDSAYGAWCDVLDTLDVMRDVIRKFETIFWTTEYSKSDKMLCHLSECIIDRTWELDVAFVPSIVGGL